MTGVHRSVLVPSPSCPLQFSPQHFAAPPVVTAHACKTSALMVATPDDKPDTVTGVNRSVVVPSPSCPEALPPQHFAAPPVVTAHVWKLPALMVATPDDNPDTATGVDWLVLVSSPSPP